MKTRKLLAGLVIVLSAQTQASAWSGPGHAAVAAMAYRELASDPTLRGNLTDLLKSHPAFATWEKEYKKDKQTYPAGLDFGMFLFIRAANWPDEIRGTKDKKLKPFEHRDWHYVDYPLYPPKFETGPSPNPNDDVRAGIEASLDILEDEDADAAERAIYLSWLIHLVGDIHQPLHCATLVNSTFKAPEGDVGGNLFRIYQTEDHKEEKKSTKLHSFWDSRLLGTSWGPPPAPQALTDAKLLESKHARADLDELSAGDDTEQWSFESRDLAISNVYQFKGKMLKQWKVLPSGYVTNSHAVAGRRLALSGYRLVDELKKVAF